jgi:hypothetical protein
MRLGVEGFSYLPLHARSILITILPGGEIPQTPFFLHFLSGCTNKNIFLTESYHMGLLTFSPHPPTSNPHNKNYPPSTLGLAFPQMRKMGFGGEKEREVGGALKRERPCGRFFGTLFLYSDL